jgi:hypothetical protein
VRPNYQKLNQLRKEKSEEQGQRYGGGSKPFGTKQHHQGQARHGQQQGQWQGGKQKGGGGGGRQRQQDGQQPQPPPQQHDQPRRAKTAEERRLESFAKPTLKKGKAEALEGAGGTKRKRQSSADDGQQQQRPPKKQQSQEQQQQADGDGPKLSKAQKKNMARAKKRAEKRQKTEGGAAP